MTRSKTKTFLISFLLAAVAVCLSVALTACKGGDKDKDSGKYGAGEEGIYYYDKDASTEYLMTLQSGTYMISADGTKGYSGTYSYDEDEKTVSFTAADGDDFSAAFTDDVMQLAIAGTDYTFLKKVDYAVKFMDGNSTVGTQAVTYGKSASKIDAEKDGYLLLGWYEDAAFTTQYRFNTAVTGDVTLYAYYIAIDTSIPNFEVQFVSGGDVIYTTTTQNGVVYDIPEVSGILGWWVSDTNDESELTYRYDGQVLCEATNLYAVKADALGVSVYENEITWEAQVSSVTITVDGTIVAPSATGNAYSYDMAALGTGAHTVEVSASGYGDETLVYVVNGLARVSNFDVYGNVLVYNAVEGAQYYYVSVECANPAHSHTMVYNGNTLTYDFSNCEMGAEGIKFTVYAYGTGYVGSVSETFVYLLKLGSAEVKIDETADLASWAAVYDTENVQTATSYEVYINGEYAATTTDTEYSLKYFDLDDNISVQVKPLAPGYYSELSEAASYKKTTLRAPEITGIDEYTVSWTEISGATNYIIYVNGKQVETVSDDITAYALSTDPDFVQADSYVITIKATNAQNTNQNSQESDPVYATDDTMSPLLVYENGTVYWQYAMAAGTYYVTVNDESETVVNGKNSFDVTFTRSGENVIKVWFTTAAGNSAEASLSVTAYAVIFDSRGGDAVDTVYVAAGDSLDLAVPGYSVGTAQFEGWYTLPDLVSDENSLGYSGDGVKISSGDAFTWSGTLVLYAYWSGVRLSVTLVVGSDGYGYLDEDEFAAMGFDSIDDFSIALNSKTYTVPVPTLSDTTKVFLGWYSQPNGNGVKYTDEYGSAMAAVTGTSALTFYAAWGTAVVLTVTSYEDQSVLAASKGDDISYAKDGVVTIPATYVVGGKEYTVAVLNSNAFYNCKTMYEINIPDTIQFVQTTGNGTSSGAGPFASCTNLKAVNVYATGEGQDPTKEVNYYSYDGVLYYMDSLTSLLTLVYYPQGKTDSEVVIPEYVYNEYECTYASGSTTEYVQVLRPVEAVATKVFNSNSNIDKITLPATIKTIESQAFSSSKIKEVEILSETSTEGVSAASTLTIASDAFKSCTSLTKVTLASRLDADSFDYGMFSGCTKLTEVYVNTVTGGTNNYTSSDDGLLLNGTGSTLVYYPVGRSTFEIDTNAVTKIGEYAVYGNTNITSVTIPSQMQEIGAYAFKNCTAVTSLTFASLNNSEAAALTICEQAFYGCTKLTSLVLPQNCTTIEVNAFGNCSKLTYVWFDSTATTTELHFADGAFAATSGSTYVTSLEIGANAPAVDLVSVFGYSLEEIQTNGNPNYNTETDGLIISSDGTLILYALSGYKGDIVIPSGVTKIQDNLFRGKNITSVSIPSSVTSIGYRVFYNCKYLASVTFDGTWDTEGLTIGQYAFYGCSGLKELTLPEGLTEIGDRAFYNCSNLTSLYIPASVREIGTVDADEEYKGAYYVFYGCSKLTLTIAEGSTYFAYADGILYGISESSDEEGTYDKTEIYMALQGATGELVLPSTTEKIWYRAFYKNTKITGLSFVDDKVNTTLEIGDEAFYGCTALAEVVLPNGLTTIGEGLFTNCSKLTKITIPNTVTSLANGVFKGTSVEEIVFAEGGTGALTLATGTSSSSVFSGAAVTSVVLPERLSSIPNYTFYNITTLEYVYIPSTVTSIGQRAFSGCTALAEVEFAENGSLTSIGDGAFYQSAIEEIELPDSVTTITAGTSSNKRGAFTECTELKTVKIPSSLSLISAYTFYECTALETVTGGGAVTEIGNYAFYNCTSLVTYNVEGTYSSTNGIGTYVFQNCSSLTTFSVGDDFELVKLGNYAFDGTAALTSFDLPDTLTSLGTYAFRNSGLTSVEIPAKLASVGNYDFQNCASLASVKFKTDETSGQSALTTVGQYAFAGTAITGVTIPETSASAGTITLDLYSFSSCEKLTSVSFSKSVSTIKFAFMDSNNITSVTVDDDNATYKVKDWSGVKLLVSKDDTTLYAAFGLSATSGVLDLTNSNLTTIGEYALSKNTGLVEVVIPYTVTQVLGNAFYYCENLTKVTFEAVPSTESVDSYVLTLTAGSNSGTSDTAACGVFSHCEALEEVTLREGLKVLSAYTFNGDTALKKLAVPDSVTEIQKDVLAGGTSMYSGVEEITFGSGSQLATIADLAFAYSKLTSITLPSGITSVPDQCFFDCYDLVSVTFLSGTVTSVGTSSASNGAFKNCTSLMSIDLTGCVTIGKQAFSGCSALEYIVIPNTVTSICSTAFYDCTSLKYVEFEDGGTGTLEITAGTNTSTGAFAGSASLERVVLSDRVASITAYTFYNCTSLKVLTYNDDENYDADTIGEGTYFSVVENIAIGNYAFYGCDFGGVIDLSNVGSVGTYMFQNNTNLTSITLPEGTTELPAGLFSGCSSVTEYTIPETVTSIGASAFTGTSIKTITIPAAVTVINANTFENCTLLEEVVFEEEGQLKTAGASAFASCTSLKTLDLTGLTNVTGNGAFQASGLTEVHITSLDFTSTSNQSYPFMNCVDLVEVELNPKMTYIQMEMFQGCTSLSKVYYTGYTDDGYAGEENVLPKTVTTLQQASFNGTALENITIPGSVSKITGMSSANYSAFGNCEKLTSVTFEEGVTEIGNYTFYACSSLTDLYIPYTVTTIGYGAFAYCTSLTEVVIEDVPDYADRDTDYSLYILNNNSEDTGAFAHCTSLVSVSLPERTVAIGSYTFHSCESLESMYIPASVTTIKAKTATTNNTYSHAFNGCTSLTEVIFGAGSVLDEIGYYAFQNCESLETITMPEKITTINQYAFEGCSSLKSIEIPSTVTSLGAYAFRYSGLEEVLVPASVTSIGTRAFESCQSLLSIDVESSNTTFRSVDGALVNSSDVIVCYPAGVSGEVVIDDTLKVTTTYAFSGCDKITRVTVGASCETLASNLFENCTALEEVVIPVETTTINSSTFSTCTSLKAVYYLGDEAGWNEISGYDYLDDVEKYWYSEVMPGFNDDGTGYEGNYWYYVSDDEIAIWTFDYVTYAVAEGGYVLYSADTDTISYVCVYDASDETSTVYAVTSCVKGSGDYTVTLESGATYTVTLSEIGATLTAV